MCQLSSTAYNYRYTPPDTKLAFGADFVKSFFELFSIFLSLFISPCNITDSTCDGSHFRSGTDTNPDSPPGADSATEAHPRSTSRPDYCVPWQPGFTNATWQQKCTSPVLAPNPLLKADCDCSGGDVPVDIDDVIHLMDYVLRGGPPPCDIDGDGVPDC
jgi:hypothetical protein